jgi:hypothetical protein
MALTLVLFDLGVREDRLVRVAFGAPSMPIGMEARPVRLAGRKRIEGHDSQYHGPVAPVSRRHRAGHCAPSPRGVEGLHRPYYLYYLSAAGPHPAANRATCSCRIFKLERIDGETHPRLARRARVLSSGRRTESARPSSAMDHDVIEALPPDRSEQSRRNRAIFVPLAGSLRLPGGCLMRNICWSKICRDIKNTSRRCVIASCRISGKTNYSSVIAG